MACTERTTKDKKGSFKMSSDGTFFADICLSGVKTAQEASDEGVDYCRSVNKSNTGLY